MLKIVSGVRRDSRSLYLMVEESRVQRSDQLRFKNLPKQFTPFLQRSKSTGLDAPKLWIKRLLFELESYYFESSNEVDSDQELLLSKRDQDALDELLTLFYSDTKESDVLWSFLGQFLITFVNERVTLSDSDIYHFYAKSLRFYRLEDLSSSQDKGLIADAVFFQLQGEPCSSRFGKPLLYAELAKLYAEQGMHQKIEGMVLELTPYTDLSNCAAPYPSFPKMAQQIKNKSYPHHSYLSLMKQKLKTTMPSEQDCFGFEKLIPSWVNAISRSSMSTVTKEKKLKEIFLTMQSIHLFGEHPFSDEFWSDRFIKTIQRAYAFLGQLDSILYLDSSFLKQILVKSDSSTISSIDRDNDVIFLIALKHISISESQLFLSNVTYDFDKSVSLLAEKLDDCRALYYSRNNQSDLCCRQQFRALLHDFSQRRDLFYSHNLDSYDAQNYFFLKVLAYAEHGFSDEALSLFRVCSEHSLDDRTKWLTQICKAIKKDSSSVLRKELYFLLSVMQTCQSDTYFMTSLLGLFSEQGILLCECDGSKLIFSPNYARDTLYWREVLSIVAYDRTLSTQEKNAIFDRVLNLHDKPEREMVQNLKKPVDFHEQAYVILSQIGDVDKYEWYGERVSKKTYKYDLYWLKCLMKSNYSVHEKTVRFLNWVASQGTHRLAMPVIADIFSVAEQLHIEDVAHSITQKLNKKTDQYVLDLFPFLIQKREALRVLYMKKLPAEEEFFQEQSLSNEVEQACFSVFKGGQFNAYLSLYHEKVNFYFFQTRSLEAVLSCFSCAYSSATFYERAWSNVVLTTARFVSEKHFFLSAAVVLSSVKSAVVTDFDPLLSLQSCFSNTSLLSRRLEMLVTQFGDKHAKALARVIHLSTAHATSFPFFYKLITYLLSHNRSLSLDCYYSLLFLYKCSPSRSDSGLNRLLSSDLFSSLDMTLSFCELALSMFKSPNNTTRYFESVMNSNPTLLNEERLWDAFLSALLDAEKQEAFSCFMNMFPHLQSKQITPDLACLITELYLNYSPDTVDDWVNFSYDLGNLSVSYKKCNCQPTLPLYEAFLLYVCHQKEASLHTCYLSLDLFNLIGAKMSPFETEVIESLIEFIKPVVTKKDDKNNGFSDLSCRFFTQLFKTLRQVWDRMADLPDVFQTWDAPLRLDFFKMLICSAVKAFELGLYQGKDYKRPVISRKESMDLMDSLTFLGDPSVKELLSDARLSIQSLSSKSQEIKQKKKKKNMPQNTLTDDLKKAKSWLDKNKSWLNRSISEAIKEQTIFLKDRLKAHMAITMEERFVHRCDLIESLKLSLNSLFEGLIKGDDPDSSWELFDIKRGQFQEYIEELAASFSVFEQYIAVWVEQEFELNIRFIDELEQRCLAAFFDFLNLVFDSENSKNEHVDHVRRDIDSLTSIEGHCLRQYRQSYLGPTIKIFSDKFKKDSLDLVRLSLSKKKDAYYEQSLLFLKKLDQDSKAKKKKYTQSKEMLLECKEILFSFQNNQLKPVVNDFIKKLEKKNVFFSKDISLFFSDIVLDTKDAVYSFLDALYSLLNEVSSRFNTLSFKFANELLMTISKTVLMHPKASLPRFSEWVDWLAQRNELKNAITFNIHFSPFTIQELSFEISVIFLKCADDSRKNVSLGRKGYGALYPDLLSQFSAMPEEIVNKEHVLAFFEFLGVHIVYEAESEADLFLCQFSNQVFLRLDVDVSPFFEENAELFLSIYRSVAFYEALPYLNRLVFFKPFSSLDAEHSRSLSANLKQLLRFDYINEDIDSESVRLDFLFSTLLKDDFFSEKVFPSTRFEKLQFQLFLFSILFQVWDRKYSFSSRWHLGFTLFFKVLDLHYKVSGVKDGTFPSMNMVAPLHELTMIISAGMLLQRFYSDMVMGTTETASSDKDLDDMIPKLYQAMGTFSKCFFTAYTKILSYKQDQKDAFFSNSFSSIYLQVFKFLAQQSMSILYKTQGFYIGLLKKDPRRPAYLVNLQKGYHCSVDFLNRSREVQALEKKDSQFKLEKIKPLADYIQSYYSHSDIFLPVSYFMVYLLLSFYSETTFLFDSHFLFKLNDQESKNDLLQIASFTSKENKTLSAETLFQLYRALFTYIQSRLSDEHFDNALVMNDIVDRGDDNPIAFRLIKRFLNRTCFDLSVKQASQASLGEISKELSCLILYESKASFFNLLIRQFFAHEEQVANRMSKLMKNNSFFNVSTEIFSYLISTLFPVFSDNFRSFSDKIKVRVKEEYRENYRRFFTVFQCTLGLEKGAVMMPFLRGISSVEIQKFFLEEEVRKAISLYLQSFDDEMEHCLDFLFKRIFTELDFTCETTMTFNGPEFNTFRCIVSTLILKLDDMHAFDGWGLRRLTSLISTSPELRNHISRVSFICYDSMEKELFLFASKALKQEIVDCYSDSDKLFSLKSQLIYLIELFRSPVFSEAVAFRFLMHCAVYRFSQASCSEKNQLYKYVFADQEYQSKQSISGCFFLASFSEASSYNVSLNAEVMAIVLRDYIFDSSFDIQGSLETYSDQFFDHLVFQPLKCDYEGDIDCLNDAFFRLNRVFQEFHNEGYSESVRLERISRDFDQELRHLFKTLMMRFLFVHLNQTKPTLAFFIFDIVFNIAKYFMDDLPDIIYEKLSSDQLPIAFFPMKKQDSEDLAHTPYTVIQYLFSNFKVYAHCSFLLQEAVEKTKKVDPWRLKKQLLFFQLFVNELISLYRSSKTRFFSDEDVATKLGRDFYSLFMEGLKVYVQELCIVSLLQNDTYSDLFKESRDAIAKLLEDEPLFRMVFFQIFKVHNKDAFIDYSGFLGTHKQDSITSFTSYSDTRLHGKQSGQFRVTQEDVL